MRHGLSGRQLNRTASHRHAMWANMVTSLVMHGRIETTVAKAKDLRRHADDAIGIGKSVAAILAKGDKATAAEKAKVVHAKRMARKVMKTREAMDKLFTEVGPHFATRPGGYTRVLKTRTRVGGTRAPMAFVELVGLAPSFA